MTAETLLTKCDEQGICLRLSYGGLVICPGGEKPTDRVAETLLMAQARLTPLLTGRKSCQGCVPPEGEKPTFAPAPETPAALAVPEIHLLMRAARLAAQEDRMPDGGVCVPLWGKGRMSLSPRRYLLRVTEEALEKARWYGDEWPAQGEHCRWLYLDWKAIAIWWQRYEKGL